MGAVSSSSMLSGRCGSEDEISSPAFSSVRRQPPAGRTCTECGATKPMEAFTPILWNQKSTVFTQCHAHAFGSMRLGSRHSLIHGVSAQTWTDNDVRIAVGRHQLVILPAHDSRHTTLDAAAVRPASAQPGT